jgi:hypothetical protein
MRRALLAGANPFVTLYDDGGAPAAYASLWRVDWSTHGPGNAIVLWHGGGVRVVTDAPALGGWLEEHFVRRFDEAIALPSWPSAVLVEAPVEIVVDPACGARAAGADVVVALGDPLDARPVGIADFPLDGVSHGLSMMAMPCATAKLTVGGAAVAGRPRVWRDGDRPYSSAVTAVHEAWSV